MRFGSRFTCAAITTRLPAGIPPVVKSRGKADGGHAALRLQVGSQGRPPPQPDAKADMPAQTGRSGRCTGSWDLQVSFFASVHFSPAVGWYSLLLTRSLVLPFTMALHVVKVYVMGVYRRPLCLRSHIDEGEREREQEGETVLTNTTKRFIKQNIKAREAKNHNRPARTTPSHINRFVDNIFLHLWI